MVQPRRRGKIEFPAPMRVLTLALVFNVILLPFLGSIVWSMYQSLSRIAANDLSLERVVGKIAHLNEVLTMYARLAAATGDVQWEQRYRKVVSQMYWSNRIARER